MNRRRSFIDVLLPSDVAAVSGSRGRALLEALPRVWGEIDDEDDGEPDPDDYGYEETELFDVLQAWVLRRLNIRPLTNVPLLDLRHLRPWRGSAAGFELCVDGMRRVPNEKGPAPLLVKCVLLQGSAGKAKKGAASVGDVLFVGSDLKMASPVSAPRWGDAKGSWSGELKGDSSVAAVVVTVHTARAEGGGAVKTAPLAWAVLPLFLPQSSLAPTGSDEPAGDHLNAGRFQLPLFAADMPLPPTVLRSFATREADDPLGARLLKAALKKRNGVRALEGASVFVRLADLQMRPELRPTAKSTVDSAQLGVGTKAKYTATTPAAKAKKTFEALCPKKEAAAREFDDAFGKALRGGGELLRKEGALAAALGSAALKEKKANAKAKKG